MRCGRSAPPAPQSWGRTTLRTRTRHRPARSDISSGMESKHANISARAQFCGDLSPFGVVDALVEEKCWRWAVRGKGGSDESGWAEWEPAICGTGGGCAVCAGGAGGLFPVHWGTATGREVQAVARRIAAVTREAARRQGGEAARTHEGDEGERGGGRRRRCFGGGWRGEIAGRCWTSGCGR